MSTDSMDRMFNLYDKRIAELEAKVEELAGTSATHPTLAASRRASGPNANDHYILTNNHIPCISANQMEGTAMMPFTEQRKRFLDNITEGVALLRKRVNDDDYMEMCVQYAGERHAEGFDTHGDNLQTMGDVELEDEFPQEIADAIVYASEEVARGKEGN